MQALVPIKHGGLGIRRVFSLVNPAFLASAASTVSPQDQILALSPCFTDPFQDYYLSCWFTSVGPLPAPLPGKQSLWDKLGLQNDRALIEDSFVEPSLKARFLASVAPHSGYWLLALLIANCSLRLDDKVMRVAVSHTVVYVVTRWMPNASIRWCAKRRQVEFLNDLIWRSLGSATFQPPRNQQDWSDKMVNGLMGSP